jgi:hypothetical protein
MATQSYNAAPQASFVAALAATVASVSSLAATPISAVGASVELTGSTKSFLASPFVSVNASAVLTGATASVNGHPISAFSASPALTGGNNSLGAAPVATFQGEFFLTGASAIMSANPVSAFTGSLNLTGASDSHGLSICDIVDQILGMWGIFCRNTAPGFAVERAIHDINHAMQLVWNNADERHFWSRSTVQITLNDGESSEELPRAIQSVIGPCRRDDTNLPLVPVGTINELETFADLYLDGDTADEPVAYHVARESESSESTYNLDVVLEPPRYVTNDLRSCPIVPIPHRYVESLILPIVRYQASTFYLFRQQDLKPTIDREYQMARIQLNLADPLPGKAGDNLNQREGGKEA